MEQNETSQTGCMCKGQAICNIFKIPAYCPVCLSVWDAFPRNPRNSETIKTLHQMLSHLWMKSQCLQSRNLFSFNVKLENSSKQEFCSNKTLFQPAPSIESKLSVENKGNKYNKDDDQQIDDVVDILEEKTKQNEEDVKLSTSRNAANVHGSKVDIDGNSP